MLPSSFYTMSPMYLQSLKLLCPTVKEVMHLQENTLHNTYKMLPSLSPPHHLTYGHAEFEFASSNGLGGDAFTRNLMEGCTQADTDGQMDNGPTFVQN